MAKNYYDNSDEGLRFQPSTLAQAGAVDQKFDEVEGGFREVEKDTRRAIKLPFEEGMLSQEFTATSFQRRNRLLGFDSAGNLTTFKSQLISEIDYEQLAALLILELSYEQLASQMIAILDYEQLSAQLISELDYEQLASQMITDIDYVQLSAQLISELDYEQLASQILSDLGYDLVSYTKTLAEAQALEGMAAGQVVHVTDDQAVWKVVVSPTIPVNGVTVVSSASLGGAFLEMISGEITSPPNPAQTTHPQSIACFEIRIPSHMPTITAALNYLSKFNVRSNSWVDILLEDGFVMQEQVFISGRNFGFVTIFGTDNDRDFVINGNFLTQNRTQDVYGVITRAAFTVVQGGTGPRIGCKFNMINGGATSNRRIGLFVSGPGSGCNMMNFRAFRNCGDTGVYANRGGYINCYGVDVSGCGSNGIYANRATMDAQNANADNCGQTGILALYNGNITAFGASAIGCGIRAGFLSKIIFNNGIATGVAGSAIAALDGSEIHADGADASGATGGFGRGVDAQGLSRITFTGGAADDCGQYGLFATSGGRIEGRDATAKRAGTAGIEASAGGVIEFGNGDARKTDDVDSADDIRVLSGGYITAVGAQGGTNVTPRTVTLGGTIIKL